MEKIIREHFIRADRKWAKYEPYFELYDSRIRSLESDDLVVENGIANGGSAEGWAGYLSGHERCFGVVLKLEAEIIERHLHICCLMRDSTERGGVRGTLRDLDD